MKADDREPIRGQTGTQDEAIRAVLQAGLCY